MYKPCASQVKQTQLHAGSSYYQKSLKGVKGNKQIQKIETIFLTNLNDDITCKTLIIKQINTNYRDHKVS